jgi:hypothetical protein
MSGAMRASLGHVVAVVVVVSCHSGSSPNVPPAQDAASDRPRDAPGHVNGSDAPVCEPVGESCSTKTQCCSAFCESGMCTCNSIGHACMHDDDCCSGLGCTNGVCGNNNPNAFAVCQACGIGGSAACADGQTYCIRAEGYDSETYCASDCTANPNVCAPDMTCTPLLDDQAQPTGKSGCLPTTQTCSAADGTPECDISCTTEGAACACAGYSCVGTEGGLFCLHCATSDAGTSCTP